MANFVPSISVTNASKAPWAPAFPALNEALAGAMNAYNTTYNGPQVAELDPLVQQGWDAQAAANGGQTTDAARSGLNAFGRVIGNGGLSDLQIGGARSIDDAIASLSPYTSGQFLKAGQNPYLEDTINSAMRDAAQGVNAQFSAAGRYGSGAQTDALASRLGTIATGARMQDYNDQQARQLQALGLLGGFAGQKAGIGQTGVSNLASSGAALSGLNAAGNLEGQNLANIGGQKMDYRQSLIDAANQAPWAKVSNLANIAGSIGGMGGTSSSTSIGLSPEQEKPRTNPLGLGLSALGLGANMFSGGAGSAFNGLKSLFSDERLKENIEKVGKTDDGQNIYAYNYKHDPMKRRTLGLLAQEVALKKPEAVSRDQDSGYLMVDYGRATGRRAA